jgi:hypothetical protein
MNCATAKKDKAGVFINSMNSKQQGWTRAPLSW